MKVIGFAGTNGAGKDTVADYVAKKYGYKKITMGDIIRERHNWSEPDLEFIEEIMMRNKASVNMLVFYRRIFQLPAVLQKNLVMVKEFLEPEQKEPKYVLANVYFELYKKVKD